MAQQSGRVDAVAAFADHVLPFVEVGWITPQTDGTATAVLRTLRRRDMSLVDCCSFAVMRGAGLTRALALGTNSAEQGFEVLPA